MLGIVLPLPDIRTCLGAAMMCAGITSLYKVGHHAVQLSLLLSAEKPIFTSERFPLEHLYCRIDSQQFVHIVL